MALLKYSITHNGNTWNSTNNLTSIQVSNGSTTTSITTAGTKTLNCAGKYIANNLVIGEKTLNCSGKLMTGNVVITSTETVDPTKTTLTEEEFIMICQQGLQSQMTVGAIITLDNTYQTQWEVIGVNHDGTSGTVDIMSHTNINNMAFSSSSNIYSGSALQTFCNSTIPNAFTNATTKSLIKTMSVVSNGSTLTGQYGKALSCTEIGYSDTYALTEGTSYGLSSYLFRSGVSSYCWTRSRYTNNPDIVWGVISSGVYVLNYYHYSRGVLPVLRF